MRSEKNNKTNGKGQQGGQDSDNSKNEQSPKFAESYAVNLTIAILALVPFIIITTAFELFSKQVGGDLGAGKTALAVISAISTAGYAFGALLGGDIIQRFPQRKLFFLCESLFVIGSGFAGFAWGVVSFGSGMVLLGFATGLLLVIALPPVIRRFPATKMPITAAVVNLGFFGATTLGPLIGGAVAFGDAWRWLYGGLSLIGIMVLALSFFTLRKQPPMNPGERFDYWAVGLALAATAFPFFASGELTGHGFDSYWFTVPLAVGMACFIAMLLTEYHQENPLSPVKMMWHTVPLVGTMAAMFGGAAFVSFLELGEMYALRGLGTSPLWAGLYFWPQVVGVLITAWLLGVLVRTRFLPALVLAGMLLLIGSGILLYYIQGSNSRVMLMAAAGLLGLGAGATVSPGLWMAGFSLPSKMVGRTFALVELVRSEADFLLAPVMIQVAQMWSGGEGHKLNATGIHHAIWVTLMVTIGITVVMVALFFLGRAKLMPPDLEDWLKGDNPAIESPPLMAVLRKDL